MLIAGFIVGWKYALAIGIITPLLSFLMPFGIPDIITAAQISAELAVYGLVIGLIYKFLKPFKTRLFNIYLSLIIAMLAGRIVGGAVTALIFGLQGSTYGFQAFLGAYFVGTFPAIILQILIVPAIIEIYENRLEKETRRRRLLFLSGLRLYINPEIWYNIYARELEGVREWTIY